jgi:hypothetical protein
MGAADSIQTKGRIIYDRVWLRMGVACGKMQDVEWKEAGMRHARAEVSGQGEIGEAERLRRMRVLFGPARKNGARRMRFAEWGELRALCALRVAPVTAPATGG